MGDAKPVVEWRFPDDDEEEKTIHTTGLLPRAGEIVNVYRRRMIGGMGTETDDERYVVDRIEWTIFDKRDDASTMGTRLDVYAVVFLREA